MKCVKCGNETSLEDICCDSCGSFLHLTNLNKIIKASLAYLEKRDYYSILNLLENKIKICGDTKFGYKINSIINLLENKIEEQEKKLKTITDKASLLEAENNYSEAITTLKQALNLSLKKSDRLKLIERINKNKYRIYRLEMLTID